MDAPTPSPARNEQATPEELEALVALHEALDVAATPGDVYRVVCRTLRRLLGADGVTIARAERDRVRYVHEDCLSPLWAGQDFPAEACVSGWVMAHAQPAVIADIRRDHRIPQQAYSPTFVRSMAMAPFLESRARGAVGAYWARIHQAGPRELGLLTRVADAAGRCLERLFAADELQAQVDALTLLAQDRERFLQWLAHDLRNPLAAILLTSKHLLSAVGPQGSDAHLQLVALRESADRMERLIHDLLDLAAIRGTGLRLSRSRVPLAALLGSTRHLLPLASERGLSLVFEPAADALVECDGDRIAQVFSNLVCNAILHASRATRVTVRGTRLGETAYFEVADDGAAIPPERLAAMSRMDGSAGARGVATGLGLGLAIARGIVEAHGGQITVRHEPGSGTVISFSLPRSVAC